jgi:signal transduction histidine kinase
VRVQEHQTVHADEGGKQHREESALVSHWLKPYTMRQLRFRLLSASIRQKIGAGYALAVGIAISGTIAGLAIGEHYQNRAIVQLTRAHQQEHLLKELQTAILQARSHASRFPVVLGNPVWLRYENEEFIQSIEQAKQAILETERFINNSDNLAKADTETLQTILHRADITVEGYRSVTQSLLRQVNAWNLKQDEILPAQQELLRNSSGEVAISLDQLFEQLNQLIERAKDQDKQAAITLKRAGALRVQVIVSSMVLSAALAVALALYTSNAIAQPIKTVTKVAQQVTEESNFELRVPVTTNDEVGVLATSLNQLIQRIAVYTKELKLAEAQLIQTEKMSSLGAMVAGVAHEINNPVNFIYGNLDYTTEYIQDLLSLVRLYQQQYPEPLPVIQEQIEAIELDFLAEDLPKILSSMKGGAERIREIVLSLRNFSRLDEAGMKAVNLHEGIDSTLILLNNRLKQRVEVIKHYGELPLVECSPAQLNQVFMNILSNAIDALEVGDKEREYGDMSTKLPASSSQPPIPTIQICTKVLDQNWVAISISDNGSGIPSAIKERIFDPFFTTKEPGKGTGLGLAISYQIITQHHGNIQVHSASNQGTEFVITLPVRASTTHSTRSTNHTLLSHVQFNEVNHNS